jgi:phosphatidate cytidylyltransferase
MQMVNPFTHPLFVPLMLAVVPLLSLSFLAVLAAERGNLSHLGESSLFAKWWAGSVLVVASILAILTGGAALALDVLAMVTVGVLEYSQITGLGSKLRNTLLVCGAGMVTAGFFLGAAALPVVLTVSLLVLAMVSMVGSDGKNFDKAALACLGLLYIPFMGVHVYLLSSLPGGTGLLLALIATTALCDTGGFVGGKLLGKRLFRGAKLAPSLSPNKTWAGVAGSVVFAFAGFFAMSFLLHPLPLLATIAIPALVVVTGIAGDLFESLMKRSFGVKDAGTWLPGFGGALDRVDAMLFVMPAGYYVLAALA